MVTKARGNANVGWGGVRMYPMLVAFVLEVCEKRKRMRKVKKECTSVFGKVAFIVRAHMAPYAINERSRRIPLHVVRLAIAG